MNNVNKEVKCRLLHIESILTIKKVIGPLNFCGYSCSQAKELEEFCFKFSLNHMTAVTQTEAFTKLDESTVKDFISTVVFVFIQTSEWVAFAARFSSILI